MDNSNKAIIEYIDLKVRQYTEDKKRLIECGTPLDSIAITFYDKIINELIQNKNHYK